MRLQGALEENILTLLCHGAEHASALTLQIDPDLFSTRYHQKIASRAITYIQAHGTAPGVHMRDLLESDLRRGDDGKILASVLDDMDALAPQLQPAYVMGELDRWIKLRQLSAMLENAMDAAHRGDLEEAEQALYQRAPTASDSPGIWLHDSQAMLAHLHIDVGDFFSSGIEILDRRDIRPARKNQFVIIGPKKSGKSHWAVEIGKQGVLHRHTVLHITLENSEQLVASHYTQALFALTSGKAAQIRVPVFKKDKLGRFTHMDFDVREAEGLNLANESAIIKKLKGLINRPRLLIKEFPSGSLTIARLIAYLDSLKRLYEFTPDLVIVDSPNRMAIRGEHIRTDLSQLFIQLRGIAVSRELAMVCTHHSNRSGDLARTVTGAAHVGEDYSILGIADIVCTISRTAAEREHGLARILVDAARGAEDQWLAMITQSFATGQFCIDSTYMSKHVEEEVDRISGNTEKD